MKERTKEQIQIHLMNLKMVASVIGFGARAPAKVRPIDCFVFSLYSLLFLELLTTFLCVLPFVPLRIVGS